MNWQKPGFQEDFLLLFSVCMASSEWQPGEFSVSYCAASILVKAYNSCRNILQRKLILSAKKYITVSEKVKITGRLKPGALIQVFIC